MASEPLQLWSAQVKVEEQRLWNEIFNGAPAFDIGYNLTRPASTIVRNRWKEQGIWQDHWTDTPRCGDRWKHEMSPQQQAKEEEDLITPNPNLPARLFQEVDGDLDKLRHDREASRPVHQFHFQTMIERERLRTKLMNLGVHWGSLSIDINTAAHINTKNWWLKWGIWDSVWLDILPGLMWQHERCPEFLLAQGGRLSSAPTVSAGQQATRASVLQRYRSEIDESLLNDTSLNYLGFSMLEYGGVPQTGGSMPSANVLRGNFESVLTPRPRHTPYTRTEASRLSELSGRPLSLPAFPGRPLSFRPRHTPLSRTLAPSLSAFPQGTMSPTSRARPFVGVTLPADINSVYQRYAHPASRHPAIPGVVYDVNVALNNSYTSLDSGSASDVGVPRNNPYASLDNGTTIRPSHMSYSPAETGFVLNGRKPPFVLPTRAESVMTFQPLRQFEESGMPPQEPQQPPRRFEASNDSDTEVASCTSDTVAYTPEGSEAPSRALSQAGSVTDSLPSLHEY
jgi:hypothetical protein